MTSTLFTDGWTFAPTGATTSTAVRLPHDAMIAEARSADGATGNHGAYFSGGSYRYEKAWTAPDDADERSYRLVFEGCFGTTRVLLAGREIARNSDPYREFSAPLTGMTPGETVLIQVLVDHRDVPDSRWFTGSGLYRPVWLEATAPTSIAPDGIHVVTREVETGTSGNDAVVSVTVQVQGPIAAGAAVAIELDHDGRLAAQARIDLDSPQATLELLVPDARLWSAEQPDRYALTVRLSLGEETVDERRLLTGLRTVAVDATRGLRINGRPVLLRGTAVHHDNGPLGAATIPAAERRRAALLKQAGFNAIRSAHNPLSRAFLDACDEFGLYVLDELTDVWFRHKTDHDAAERFHDEWQHAAASMIAKDRNRPSVILYSIGNEIAEAVTPEGIDIAQRIHAFFAAADPTRPTTIAVNPLLAMMAARKQPKVNGEEGPPERRPATSTVANELAAKMGRLMVLASTLPAANRATRDVFSTVDIAGYNYGYAAYRGSRRRHPERVILGTESMPGDLPAIWRRVTSIPGVIGDFSWTGWDYLGEVGLGYWTYGSEPGGIAKPYPGVIAGCGVFDITGAAGATLLLIRAVWGLATEPGIAVRPLDRVGRRANRTPWLVSDALLGWSWRGRTGTAEIEVYSAEQQVELILNGRSLGRRAAGPKRGYRATFRTPYEPGELLAIAYRDGVETGRSVLRSAGRPRLRLRAESMELRGPDDLAYVWLELADENGTVDLASEDRLTVTVTGPGTLAAVGSAAPATEESFTANTRRTHRGRALAIIRGSDLEGAISIRVSSERHGEADLTISAAGQDAPRHTLDAPAREELV